MWMCCLSCEDPCSDALVWWFADEDFGQPAFAVSLVWVCFMATVLSSSPFSLFFASSCGILQGQSLGSLHPTFLGYTIVSFRGKAMPNSFRKPNSVVQ